LATIIPAASKCKRGGEERANSIPSAGPGERGCEDESLFRKDWQHVATAKLAEMRKGLMQQVMDTGESGFRFSLGLTCNIYVVVFETPNLGLSIPLVLFDLATALPAITLQISVTIPINRLKRCRFAVTLSSVACPNA